MYSLGVKLEEYWEEIRYKKKKENPNSKPVEETMFVLFFFFYHHPQHLIALTCLICSCSDSCPGMSSEKDQTKPGYTVTAVRNGANSLMVLTVRNYRISGTAI